MSFYFAAEIIATTVRTTMSSENSNGTNTIVKSINSTDLKYNETIFSTSTTAEPRYIDFLNDNETTFTNLTTAKPRNIELLNENKTTFNNFTTTKPRNIELLNENETTFSNFTTTKPRNIERLNGNETSFDYFTTAKPRNIELLNGNGTAFNNLTTAKPRNIELLNENETTFSNFTTAKPRNIELLNGNETSFNNFTTPKVRNTTILDLNETDVTVTSLNETSFGFNKSVNSSEFGTELAPTTQVSDRNLTVGRREENLFTGEAAMSHSTTNTPEKRITDNKNLKVQETTVKDVGTTWKTEGFRKNIGSVREKEENETTVESSSNKIYTTVSGIDRDVARREPQNMTQVIPLKTTLKPEINNAVNETTVTFSSIQRQDEISSLKVEYFTKDSHDKRFASTAGSLDYSEERTMWKTTAAPQSNINKNVKGNKEVQNGVSQTVRQERTTVEPVTRKSEKAKPKNVTNNMLQDYMNQTSVRNNTYGNDTEKGVPEIFNSSDEYRGNKSKENEYERPDDESRPGMEDRDIGKGSGSYANDEKNGSFQSGDAESYGSGSAVVGSGSLVEDDSANDGLGSGETEVDSVFKESEAKVPDSEVEEEQNLEIKENVTGGTDLSSSKFQIIL